MGKIQVLDFETANRIAAGEVVDRPASVMKELLENAVDAGARHIVAEVRRGGVALLRVTDDGCGMTPEDLPIAICRHATSKIRSGSDLDNIVTLGFRGEALAAIASVSKIHILSRVEGAPMGTLLSAEAGHVTEAVEVGCAEGTTVSVEELFYNVPARRKFLKKDATETLAVLAMAEKLALSRPDIAISFIADGNLRFSTAGDGNLKNALYAVLGREFAQRLLEVKSENNGIRLQGYVGRSDNTRNNRNYQNVFINGRYVKSRTVMAALEQAYTSYIAQEKFPVCALFLEMPPALVDVNVHPAKLEVKFADERQVFETVYYAVRAALETAVFRPELTLAKEAPKKTDYLHSFKKVGEEKPTQMRVFDIPPKIRVMESAPERAIPTAAPPSKAATPERSFLTPKESREILEAYKKSESSSPSPRVASPILSEVASSDAEKEASPKVPAPLADRKAEPDTPLPSYRLIGEAFNCYILVEVEGKLLVIDQHAAHERILFEELLQEQKNGGSVTAQTLLLPLSCTLSPEETAAAIENQEELSLAGYEYTLNDCLCDITAIPSQVDVEDAGGLFAELCNALYHGYGDPTLSTATRREKSLYRIACKAAIKGGRAYGRSLLVWLVEKLLRLPDITVCPHGRPVAMTLEKSELDRRFERTK